MKKQRIVFGKLVIRIITCFFFAYISLCTLHVVYADAESSKHPLGDNYRNAAQILYLENGNIVYALLNGKTGEPTAFRQVERVICVDTDGNQLWTCSTPSLQNVIKPLIQTEDGSFVILGKNPDKTYCVVIVTPTGQIKSEIALPIEAQSPFPTASGVVYAKNTESEKGYALCRLNWSGETEETVFPSSSNLTVMQAESIGDMSFIAALSMGQDGKKDLSLLCLDQTWAAYWQYDAGPYDTTLIQSWTSNDLGGITLMMQETQNTGTDKSISINSIVCLNGDGTIAWRDAINSRLYFPTVHVISQRDDGSYGMWGSAGTSVSGNDIIFFLAVDREGNYLEERFAQLPHADCHRYTDGAVYVVSHNNEMDAEALIPFDKAESITADHFAIVRK